MAIVGNDHTVLLVRDIEVAVATWRDGFGMTLSHRVDYVEGGLAQAFFTLDDGTFIELIAPLDAASPINGVLESRGEGVHVVALAVDDLDATVEAMQNAGVVLIGVGSQRVFIHPKSANGVMIQLWPKDRPHRWRGDVGETEIER